MAWTLTIIGVKSNIFLKFVVLIVRVWADHLFSNSIIVEQINKKFQSRH